MKKLLENRTSLKILILLLVFIILALSSYIFSFYFKEKFFYSLFWLFIQVSITIGIFELFISKWIINDQRQQTRDDFRHAMGIDNDEKFLLQELINLNNPHPYTVSNMTVVESLERSGKNPLKFDSVSEAHINIISKEDNVHYDFIRSANDQSESEIISVEMDGFKLNRKWDIYDDDEHKGRHQIKKKLIKDKAYKIIIKSRSKASMTDLDGIEERDWFEYSFIELTKNFHLTLNFPFPIKDYYFYARKTTSCRKTDKIKIKKDEKKNRVTLFAENLYNNDVIRVIYEKK